MPAQLRNTYFRRALHHSNDCTRVRRVLLRNEPQQRQRAARAQVQPVQQCGGTTAPKRCSPQATGVQKKNKKQSGTSCDAPMCQSVTYGATSSTREPICGLLSPKGQAHTPPGNLWLYKNAGTMCYECLRTDARKTTRHKTRSAADGRREGSRRHCWSGARRGEPHLPRRRAGLWRSK